MVGVKWDNGNYGYYRWRLRKILHTFSLPTHRMGAGNKYELRTAIPRPPPTPPPAPSPESEYESEYESEEEEEKSPSPPPPARNPTPPPPQCEMCGLLLTENCLRYDMSSASVLEILKKKKLLAPLCAWIARASFGEERHQGGSSQRPHRHHRWHKDKDTTFNTFFDRDKISNSYCKPF